MNFFYKKIFIRACKSVNIPLSLAKDEDEIILQAIEQLNEKDKDFITSLIPYHFDSMNSSTKQKYIKMVKDRFYMNSKQIRDNTDRIKQLLLNHMKNIL